MDTCCDKKVEELAALRNRHSRVLWTVLLINAAMFFIEAGVGLAAHSSSLLADSLDMLGDTVVYGVSLYALTRGTSWKAGASLFKGTLMLALGLSVLIETFGKLLSPVVPSAPTMGLIGGLALLANGVCFALLYRHRDDDINLRSTWRCSRNDIIGNLGVLGAGGGVALTHSMWPDIVVGAALATLILLSAASTIRESYHAYRNEHRPRPTA